jgi:hypothetical protein
MRIKELLLESRPSLSGTVTAYHGGTGFPGGFDLKFSGSGEGYRILGPGMYFITNKYMAAKYCQHAISNPTVYTVQLNVTNYYNNSLVPSKTMLASMDAIAVEMGYASSADVPYSNNSLTNGRGYIGSVVQKVGHAKGLALFQKHGIDGAMEHIDGDIWELSCFNLGACKIVDREAWVQPKQ